MRTRQKVRKKPARKALRLDGLSFDALLHYGVIRGPSTDEEAAKVFGGSKVGLHTRYDRDNARHCAIVKALRTKTTLNDCLHIAFGKLVL